VIQPRSIAKQILNAYRATVLTRRNMRRNAGKATRRLEIGPGETRIQGYETLNIMPGRDVDYVWDATRRLPFADETFDAIYASHVVEHIAWYQTRDVLADWTRVLKKGGQIEIFVPNGLKIAKAWIDAEVGGSREFETENWFRYNEEKDPCLWAAGRFFTYGDGTGDPSHPNWHRAIFSPRYLEKVMLAAGLRDIEQLDAKAVRGYDHGWINLGMRGTRP